MKKQIWSLLLTLILVCFLLPGAALAEGEAAPPSDGAVHTEKGMEYVFTGGSWTVKSYTGSANSVSILSEIQGKDVTAVGEYAFSSKTGLTSVTIPKTVQTIGDYAFNSCKALNTVTISAGGLTTVGARAFYKCEALANISLPYGVESIGESAFAECTKLTGISLPDSLTSIGNEAFFASGLTKVEVPGGVTSIGSGVFQKCAGLASVTLDGGLKSIGAHMFASCGKLTKIVIPNSVTTIADSAFQNSGLTSVMLSDQVSSLGANAFYSCKNLKTLVIPGTISTLPADAITGCQNLKTIHYTGAGTLGSVPEGIEVHAASAVTEKDKGSTCAEAGAEKVQVACKETGCKESLPTELRPLPKEQHVEVAVAAVDPTCTKKGKTAGKVCQGCGMVISAQEDIPALGHAPEDSDSVIEEVAPTCGADGYKIIAQICTNCGEALSTPRTETLPATGSHVKQNPPKETVTKEPTCGEEGEKRVQDVCEVCGQNVDDYRTETIPATGEHTWGDPVTEITKKPTCTEEGEQVEKVVCKDCGQIQPGSEKTTKLDRTDHRYDVKDAVDVEGGVIQEANCTDPGLKNMKVICADCRQEITVEVEIPARGHSFGAGAEMVLQKPTCTEKGIKAFGYAVCDECGIERQDRTEEIPALGHDRGEDPEVDEENSKEPTCTEPGYQIILESVCVREGCDEVLPEERVELPALGHETGGGLEEAITKEATCAEEGIKHISTTCTRCGEALQAADFPIPPKGHTFGEWVVTKTATATVPGSRERTCSVCQEKETEVIPAGNGSTEDPSKPGDSETPTDPDKPAVTYYDVDVIRSSNGSVSCVSQAAAGETVTLTLRPYSGYELDSVEVTRWSNGRDVRLSGSGNRYSFVMPSADVEVRAYFTRISSYYSGSSSSTWQPSTTTTTTTTTPAPVTIQPIPRASGYTASFADVPSGHWAAGEVAWASQNGYMSGVGGGRFNPSGGITSQQLWMVLGRFMGANPGSMEAARLWAVENGFAEGTNPVSPVTRQQMVVALYRCAWLLGNRSTQVASLTNYVDSRNVAASARNAMGWAVASGIISGNADACLNPNGIVTRDQFAVFLYRFNLRR